MATEDAGHAGHGAQDYSIRNKTGLRQQAAGLRGLPRVHRFAALRAEVKGGADRLYCGPEDLERRRFGGVWHPAARRGDDDGWPGGPAPGRRLPLAAASVRSDAIDAPVPDDDPPLKKMSRVMNLLSREGGSHLLRRVARSVSPGIRAPTCWWNMAQNSSKLTVPS